MPAPLLLLDGASMWFRSYFGVPSSITSPDGRPVNALRGFLDAVATVITRERPRRLVVCRDETGGPQWRVDLRPVVQGAPGRGATNPTGEPDIEEVPDELTPQVDMIMEILDAFGIRDRRRARTTRPTTCSARWPTASVKTRWSSSAATATCCRWSATNRCRSGCSTWAAGWPRRRSSARPRSPNTYGVPVDRAGPAYAELALLRGDPSDGLPGVAGYRREDRGDAAGPVRLAGSDPRGRRRSEVEAVQGISHEAAGRRGLHRQRRARWCGWPPTRR